jgi:hypothetical protein
MLLHEPNKIAELEGNRLDTILSIQKNRMEFALEHATKPVSMSTLSDARSFIAENTKIEFSDEQLTAILSLYPMERSKLAEYGWGDTEVKGLTLDVVAHFFLSSRWPQFRDGEDVLVKFLARMWLSASKMGYFVQK